MTTIHDLLAAAKRTQTPNKSTADADVRAVQVLLFNTIAMAEALAKIADGNIDGFQPPWQYAREVLDRIVKEGKP